MGEKENRQVHNLPKKIRNGFDNWIGRHFKGLSAFTLSQLLKMETNMAHAYIEDIVYVDLFNMFLKKDTCQETKCKFDYCKYVVECANWL